MQKKKGISLIVLVITIIVMIILATAIIISLNNNNIISLAQEAKDRTNEAEKKQLDIINELENWLKGNSKNETYTVKFYNYDGTILQTVDVEKGKTAVYPKTSVVLCDISSSPYYKFTRWVTQKGGKQTANLANVNSNLDVYADYVKITDKPTTDVIQVLHNTIVELDGNERTDEYFVLTAEDTDISNEILKNIMISSKTFKNLFKSENNIDMYNIYEFISVEYVDYEPSSFGEVNYGTAEIDFTTDYTNKNFFVFLGITDESNELQWFELEASESEGNLIIIFGSEELDKMKSATNIVLTVLSD